MAQSPAVVDLNEFRRRKQARAASARPASPRAAVPVPVWIMWVPVWFVA